MVRLFVIFGIVTALVATLFFYISNNLNCARKPINEAVEDEYIPPKVSVYAVKENGTVYSWGYNGEGLLGLGDLADRNLPVEISALSGKKVSLITTTQHAEDFTGSTMALTESGELYLWGNNSLGQLGLGDNESRNTPHMLSALSGKKITAVHQIMHGAIALTSEGELYFWGNGIYAPETFSGLAGKKIISLLAGTTDAIAKSDDGVNYLITNCGEAWAENYEQKCFSLRELSVLADKDAVKIVSTNEASAIHNIALTSGGELYVWGDNNGGQLGLGHDESIYQLEKVTHISHEQVTEVLAGYGSSFAITSEGKLYTWGFNFCGQLGLGDDVLFRTAPQEVKELSHEKIVSVTNSDGTTFAITAAGKLYSWGNNEHGQLGIGDAGDYIYIPQEVTRLSDKKVTSVTNAKGSIFAVTSNGELYSWGNNESNQLALTHNENQNTPQRVTALENEKIISVKDDGNSLFAHTINDELYTWGNNLNGQLGLGRLEETVQIPQKVNFPN